VTNRAAPALRASALVGATLLASGCAVFSPVQTQVSYPPAEGVSLSTADIEFRDLALVSSAAGADAVLIGQAVNETSSAIEVAFAIEGQSTPTTTTVPAKSGETLSDDSTSLTIPSVSAGPGQVIELLVSTSASGQNVVTVPVLLDEGFYADLAPAE
jgi:hypothetical protein